eukprot:gene14373-20376_t
MLTQYFSLPLHRRRLAADSYWKHHGLRKINLPQPEVKEAIEVAPPPPGTTLQLPQPEVKEAIEVAPLALEAPKSTDVELVLNNVWCKGAMKFAAVVASATGFPGAGFIASAMEYIVQQAETTGNNMDQCVRIVTLVKSCDKAMGRPLSTKIVVAADCNTELEMLHAAIKLAYSLVKDFNEEKLYRLVLASGMEEKLKTCMEKLGDSMKTTRTTRKSQSKVAWLRDNLYTAIVPLLGPERRLAADRYWKHHGLRKINLPQPEVKEAIEVAPPPPGTTLQLPQPEVKEAIEVAPLALEAPKSTDVELVLNNVWCKGAMKFAAVVASATGFPGAGFIASAMEYIVQQAETTGNNMDQCVRIVTLVKSCDKAMGRPLSTKIVVAADCNTELEMLHAAIKLAYSLVKDFNEEKLYRLVLASGMEEKLKTCMEKLGDSMLSLTMVLSFGLGSVMEIKALNASASADARGRRKDNSSQDFLELLVEWWNDHMESLDLPKFERYDKDLYSDLHDAGILMPPQFATAQTSGSGLPSPLFLHHVLLPMLDVENDGQVSEMELGQLNRLAMDYAQQAQREEPVGTKEDAGEVQVVDMRSLLDTVDHTYDYLRLVDRLYLMSNDAVGLVVKGLGMGHIISSYKVSQMLSDYVPHSREWMYEEMVRWLDAGLLEEEGGSHTDTGEWSSQVFLLVAPAGMGKTVLSAVMRNKLVVRSTSASHGKGTLYTAQHFFKVNEARAQAKAMILSLVQQLAQSLPGLAALLVPVVEKDGAAGSLSSSETFEHYLLKPLQQLHSKGKLSGQVVLLIDALDEADDGGRGWLPVVSLIARE